MLITGSSKKRDLDFQELVLHFANICTKQVPTLNLRLKIKGP